MVPEGDEEGRYSKEFRAGILRGMIDFKKGRVYSSKEVKKRLWLTSRNRPEEKYADARDYYDGVEGKAYSSSKALERIQRGITLRCIELAMPSLDSRVLDAGCGNGYSMRVLKELGFKKIKGIDSSRAMVEKAKATGFDAVEGNLVKLPFGRGEFDFIVSVSVLQWLKEKEFRKVAREFKRVLSEKGKAVAQFYPKSEREARAWAKAFKECGFRVETVVDNALNARKRKVFLVLGKRNEN